jgi:hypothetical protein
MTSTITHDFDGSVSAPTRRRKSAGTVYTQRADLTAQHVVSSGLTAPQPQIGLSLTSQFSAIAEDIDRREQLRATRPEENN